MAKNDFISFMAGFQRDERFQKVLAALARWPNEQHKSMLRALNRAGKSTRTYIVSKIMGRYTLKKKYADRYVSQFVSENETLRVYANAPVNIPLSNFAGSMTKKGWSPKVLKGHKGNPMPYTFVLPGRNSGKMLVFKRSGEEHPRAYKTYRGKKLKGAVTRPRMPIKVEYADSGLSFILKHNNTQDVLDYLDAVLMKELRSDVEFRLKKIRGEA